MNWRTTAPQDILERIKECKIVGMGGAGYPTNLKIAAAMDAKSRVVIANGVETDPGVTADRTLLAHHGVDVLEGILIVARILNTTSCHLAVDDSDLASELRKCGQHSVAVTPVKPSYQIGEERVLIRRLTNKHIPADAYPAQDGIVVLNVATLYALCKCVRDGIAPTHRMVTVLGIDEWHQIGTTVCSLIPDIRKVRLGSSATGRVAERSDVLEATHNAISQDHSLDSIACIRCGKCTAACPRGLPVERMYEESTRAAVSPATLHNLRACNECGACVVACPSRIHLLDHIRNFRSHCEREAVREENSRKARSRHQSKQARVRHSAEIDRAKRRSRMQQDHQWQ